MLSPDEIERLKIARKDRVPICGITGLTVARAIWDEAWIAYDKQYRGGTGQFYRLLNEGFYVSELDELRPGWRPVDTAIREQAEQLRKTNEALTEAREELEGYALYCSCWVQDDETKLPHYRKCQGQDARLWLERHPAPTGPSEGEREMNSTLTLEQIHGYRDDAQGNRTIVELVDHIDEQAEQLRKTNEALDDARELIMLLVNEGYQAACDWVSAHPAPTGPSEGE